MNDNAERIAYKELKITLGKAYTENAMLKRILVDFYLLKTLFPDIDCFLFQLESQLGGDYSTLQEPTYGSPATHTLCSYFAQVDLKIFTFLESERLVDKPIHKHFKPLLPLQIHRAIHLISRSLEKFV